MRSYNAVADTSDLPCGAGTPRGRSLQPCKPLQGCEVVEQKAILMSCCAPFQLQDTEGHASLKGVTAGL